MGALKVASQDDPKELVQVSVNVHLPRGECLAEGRARVEQDATAGPPIFQLDRKSGRALAVVRHCAIPVSYGERSPLQLGEKSLEGIADHHCLLSLS